MRCVSGRPKRFSLGLAQARQPASLPPPPLVNRASPLRFPCKVDRQCTSAVLQWAMKQKILPNFAPCGLPLRSSVNTRPCCALGLQRPRGVHSVRLAVFAAAEGSGASPECPPRVARAPQEPVAHVSRWPVATPHRAMRIAIVHCSSSAEALTVHFLRNPIDRPEPALPMDGILRAPTYAARNGHLGPRNSLSVYSIAGRGPYCVDRFDSIA